MQSCCHYFNKIERYSTAVFFKPYFYDLTPVQAKEVAWLDMR